MEGVGTTHTDAGLGKEGIEADFGLLIQLDSIA